MQDIYKVRLDGELIGFFFASTWGDAAKAGAAHHKNQNEAAESIYWGHFMATWLNPKHYEQEGVPKEMYQEEESIA